MKFSILPNDSILWYFIKYSIVCIIRVQKLQSISGSKRKEKFIHEI
jgi:hypothetical protein